MDDGYKLFFLHPLYFRGSPVTQAMRAAENGSTRDSSEADRIGRHCLVHGHGFFLSWRNGAAITTVDHADIRGLVTACLAFVVELPLARVGSLPPGVIP